MTSIDDYIKSEKFIWDGLILSGEKAVHLVRSTWRTGGFAMRSLYAWPAEHLQTPTGTITHIVSFEVPEEMSTFDAAKQLAEKTKAYALMLIEPNAERVKIILESHHGTRAWTMPIRRHGDIDVLEKEEATTNTENIGVLWRPRTART